MAQLLSEDVRITIKIYGKTFRGYNYEVTITDAETVAEAIHLIDQAEEELDKLYSPIPEVVEQHERK